MDRNPKFELSQIQLHDNDGLWVTAFDANGMEVEVTITGLTPKVMRVWEENHQKSDIAIAIDYAAKYDISLARTDFQIIDGEPCIDGMDPIEWIDHLSGKATGDLDE
jgi:hypothetical protein